MLSKKFWFHEDDFQQVQCLPMSCWDFCTYQLYEITRHEAAHAPTGQVGLSKMYNIPAAPVAFADLSISISDLAAAMPWRLRKTSHILSGGWSDDGTRQQNMAAYMAGSCAIVFSWNESNIINSLWFRDGYISRRHRGPLLEAFFRISVLRPMLLADWRGSLIDLSDRNAIRHYLENFGPGERTEGDKTQISETATPIAPDGSTDDIPQNPPPPKMGSLHRFDCPVWPALITRQSINGQTQAVLTCPDEQYWLLEVDGPSSSRDAEFTLCPLKLTGDEEVSDWVDLTSDKILVVRDYEDREQLEVHHIGDGGLIYANADAYSAVMTPDGNSLLLLTDDGIEVADLTQPTTPVRQSGLFTVFGIDPADETADLSARRDRPLDVPGAITVASMGPESFALAIGDYGFVVVANVRLGGADEPPLILTERAQKFAEGLLYDPVEIVSLIPGESVTVRHGYGCGLTRFDLKSRAETHCPLPAGNPEIRYGAFHRVVQVSNSPETWVRTDLGPYLWDGADTLTPIGEDAGSVIATDGENYIGLSQDGWDLVGGQI